MDLEDPTKFLDVTAFSTGQGRQHLTDITSYKVVSEEEADTVIQDLFKLIED